MPDFEEQMKLLRQASMQVNFSGGYPTYPNLADLIVSVQPMTEQAGSIFFLESEFKRESKIPRIPRREKVVGDIPKATLVADDLAPVEPAEKSWTERAYAQEMADEVDREILTALMEEVLPRVEPTIDGLTVAQCLERYTRRQRQDLFDETTFLTPAQTEAARVAWAEQIRSKP